MSWERHDVKPDTRFIPNIVHELISKSSAEFYPDLEAVNHREYSNFRSTYAARYSYNEYDNLRVIIIGKRDNNNGTFVVRIVDEKYATLFFLPDLIPSLFDEVFDDVHIKALEKTTAQNICSFDFDDVQKELIPALLDYMRNSKVEI